MKEEEGWIKKAKNDPNLSQQIKAKETALEKYKASEDWVEQPPKVTLTHSLTGLLTH